MAQRHQDRGLCLKHKWTRRITFLVFSEKYGKATSMYLMSRSPYLNKKLQHYVCNTSEGEYQFNQMLNAYFGEGKHPVLSSQVKLQTDMIAYISIRQDETELHLAV